MAAILVAAGTPSPGFFCRCADADGQLSLVDVDAGHALFGISTTNGDSHVICARTVDEWRIHAHVFCRLSVYRRAQVA